MVLCYLRQDKVRSNDRRVLGMVLGQEGTGNILGCLSLAFVLFNFSLSSTFLLSFYNYLLNIYFELGDFCANKLALNEKTACLRWCIFIHRCSLFSFFNFIPCPYPPGSIALFHSKSVIPVFSDIYL